ncbi:hypothetical protein ACFQZQ_00610 [Lysobacter koreensis]|uniref:EF-hand domain-containing protein n=1 Tax=Lysobacter koreensis TaxID=266122 RepID=A0ABW2YHU5_9GAMM
MSKQSSKPVSLIVTAALVGGLGLSASAFAMSDLSQGYLLSAGEAHAHADKTKAGEGKCGEGKCGEGKCGMDKMDTDKDGRISQAEFGAAHDGDTSKFAAHDPNQDGFISAEEMKTHKEGKCGEGKCGADKKAGDKKADMEGKCGEGKCGGMA